MKKIIIIVVIVIVLVGVGLGTYFTIEASATQKTTTGENKAPKKVERPVKSNEKPKVDYNNISYKEVNFNGISIQAPTFLSEESGNDGGSGMILSSVDNSVVLNLIKVPNTNGIENYFNQAVSNTSNIVYKYVNTKTFSLSWESGENGIYESGIINRNSIIIFKITFPEKNKDKISATITKIYKSFIANMSNENTTISLNNNQNQQLTFNEASNYLYKYLVDTNQWIKKSAKYTPAIIDISGNDSSVGTLSAANFSNDAVTEKCINKINENAPIYYLWYVEDVQDSPTLGGHQARIGSYYIVQNGIYYENAGTMTLEKVAIIDNGVITNVRVPAGV